ncbi:hypothetical protein Tco_1486638 [Tanacetum coccineum]
MSSASKQTDETLFERQTTLINQMQQMHKEMRGGFKSFGKVLKGVFSKKKKRRHMSEMDFRSFMVGGIDGEFNFELEGGFVDGKGNSPSNRDSDDVSLGRDTVREAERLLPPQASKVAGDASDPLDVDSDPDIYDFVDCHFVVAYAVLYNMLNGQTRQLMSALEKAKTSCDAIRKREIKKDKAYVELERKCNEA